MKKFFSVLAVFGLFLCPACAQAADSTSFNPVFVPVKAKGSGGVPVGTIVAWPSWTNPSDMDNWLECNGQWVNPAVYPELSAIVGGNAPDYQGLFLRGVGGNSAGIGMFQNHMSGESISHVSIPTHEYRSEDGIGSSNTNPIMSDVFSRSYNRVSEFEIVINSGNPETRPVNKAVRYFIRARQ